jgi:hypothetical protein
MREHNAGRSSRSSILEVSKKTVIPKPTQAIDGDFISGVTRHISRA